MSKNKRIFGAAGAALGLGGFSVALGGCCALPWAVALLGVTGAINLARLAKYQPYFLIAAALLLGLAFYWVYRTVPAHAGNVCATTDSRRIRRIVWIVAVLLAVLMALSLLPVWPYL